MYVLHIVVFLHRQLHTSELDDGLDWNKLNLRSVTEESQLDEFLRTAELAGTEFTAGEPVSNLCTNGTEELVRCPYFRG